jgi:hypothetical protein
MGLKFEISWEPSFFDISATLEEFKSCQDPALRSKISFSIAIRSNFTIFQQVLKKPHMYLSGRSGCFFWWSLYHYCVNFFLRNVSVQITELMSLGAKNVQVECMMPLISLGLRMSKLSVWCLGSVLPSGCCRNLPVLVLWLLEWNVGCSRAHGNEYGYSAAVH